MRFIFAFRSLRSPSLPTHVNPTSLWSILIAGWKVSIYKMRMWSSSQPFYWLNSLWSRVLSWKEEILLVLGFWFCLILRGLKERLTLTSGYVRTLSFLRYEIDWLSFQRIGSIHSQDPTGPFMLLYSTQTGHTDLIAKILDISLEWMCSYLYSK